ncbi:DUF1990 family protein [Lysinimonas soli]|uniref:DUF1990 family protein n=1 Tax=Lysinimonas soli TaxID=1074233 RepID=A0ABW0NPH2_9MICO
MAVTEHPPLWQIPVTYAAVGATQADDLLRYPPKGFRPIEQRVRIGHGPIRWEYAWVQTLSWGIQRQAGFRVEVLDSPIEVSEGTYLPVAFDGEGTPVQPATTAGDGELVFAPDGSALVRPGDTALLKWRLWPAKIPARVVYVIDEPDRKGFAYGTLPGHPERGEEAFVVERRADDSVWLVIRAFSRPANAFFWAAYPALRLLQAVFTDRYKRALAGPIDE